MLLRLKNQHEKRILTSFFCDRSNPNSANVGYVIAYNNDCFILSAITPEGEDDGYVFRIIEDIFKLEYDGPYEKKIEYLHQQYEKNSVTTPSLKPDDNLLLDLIKSSLLDGKIIGVGLEGVDSIAFGLTVEYDDETLTYREVDEYGEMLGYASVRLSDIDFLEIDSRSCKELKYLMDNFSYHCTK